MTDSSERTSTTEIAEDLSKRPTDAALLDKAEEEINAGRGPELFRVLLRTVRDQADENAVREVMRLTDLMMSVRVNVAAYLMARLYPIAGKKYDNDIYDAIDMTLSGCRDESAARFILKLISEGVGPRLTKRYTEWAKSMRGEGH